jgi:hypothetical protein
MTALMPELTVVTAGVGAVMIRLGVTRGLLQPGKAPRGCPSCGRLIGRRACRSCAGHTR